MSHFNSQSIRNFIYVATVCHGCIKGVWFNNIPSLQARRPNNGVWGTDVSEDVELDKQRLEEALRKLDERDKQQTEADDRKRKYNSLQTDGEMPTEEEMEAYRMKKARDEDPMAKIIALKAATSTSYEFV